MGLLVLGLFMLSACDQTPEEATTVVVYDGARLIVGDGSVIDNATFTVNDGRVVSAGPSGEISIPTGAGRVNLAGMTVIPAIVDAHTHMSTTRDALIAARGLQSGYQNNAIQSWKVAADGTVENVYV